MKRSHLRSSSYKCYYQFGKLTEVNIWRAKRFKIYITSYSVDILNVWYVTFINIVVLQFLKLSNLLTPRYSWNTAKVGVNHQSTNKPMNFIKTLCNVNHATIYFKVMDVLVLFFRLHQEEKDYILSMAISMIPWIADINERKKFSNSCKLSRPENMSVDSFVDNMELILNRVITMKKEM